MKRKLESALNISAGAFMTSVGGLVVKILDTPIELIVIVTIAIGAFLSAVIVGCIAYNQALKDAG